MIYHRGNIPEGVIYYISYTIIVIGIIIITARFRPLMILKNPISSLNKIKS